MINPQTNVGYGVVDPYGIQKLFFYSMSTPVSMSSLSASYKSLSYRVKPEKERLPHKQFTIQMFLNFKPVNVLKLLGFCKI